MMKIVNISDPESVLKVKNEIETLYKEQDPSYVQKEVGDFISDVMHDIYCYVKNDDITAYQVLDVDSEHSYLFVHDTEYTPIIAKHIEDIRSGKCKFVKKSTFDIYKDGMGPNLYNEYFIHQDELLVLDEN